MAVQRQGMDGPGWLDNCTFDLRVVFFFALRANKIINAVEKCSPVIGTNDGCSVVTHFHWKEIERTHDLKCFRSFSRQNIVAAKFVSCMTCRANVVSF